MTYVAGLILLAIIYGIFSALDRKPKKQLAFSSSGNAIPHKLRDIPTVNDADNLLRSYNSYYVRSPSIPQYRGKVWQQRYSSIIRRNYSKADRINCDDLDFMRVSKTIGLIESVEERILELGNSRYPDSKPALAKDDIPPPQPLHLIDLQALKGLLKGKAASRAEKAQLLAHAEAINKMLEASFSSATEKYDIQSSRALRAIEAVQNDWQAARDHWNRERQSELDSLTQFGSDFATVQDVELVTKLILNALCLPVWIPDNFEVKYEAANRILIIEHQLPNVEELELYKNVQLKTTLSKKPLNQKERKEVVSEFYPLIVLRIAIDIAHQMSPDWVELLVFNGWVDYRNKATGQLSRAYCASIAAKLDELKNIDLQFANPVAAFSSIKGAVSKSLEIVPIAPTLRINQSDPRFIDGREILSALEGGENLAAMDWDDFEHLCRELFEREFVASGATVKVTRASRDQGVDAIITDPDPIRGGKIVIQAKRYVNTVDVSAVRDLAGTVAHEGAMKGLLVTTSQFGPDSYAFIQGKPLSLINGSELLYLLSKHGYKFKIDLEEARQMQKESGNPPFRRRS